MSPAPGAVLGNCLEDGECRAHSSPPPILAQVFIGHISPFPLQMQKKPEMGLRAALLGWLPGGSSDTASSSREPHLARWSRGAPRVKTHTTISTPAEMAASLLGAAGSRPPEPSTGGYSPLIAPVWGSPTSYPPPPQSSSSRASLGDKAGLIPIAQTLGGGPRMSWPVGAAGIGHGVNGALPGWGAHPSPWDMPQHIQH